MRELGLFLPAWVEALEGTHPIKKELYSAMLAGARGISRVRDLESALAGMRECEIIGAIKLAGIDMGTGVAIADIDIGRELFYKTLAEQSGFDVADDGDLMALLNELAAVKEDYDKVSSALRDVRETGYGIVLPSTDELTLEEPEIVRQGGRYGVRLRASAPSVHIECIERQLQVWQKHLCCRSGIAGGIKRIRAGYDGLLLFVFISNDIPYSYLHLRVQECHH